MRRWALPAVALLVAACGVAALVGEGRPAEDGTGAEDLTPPWSDEVDGVLEEKGVPFRRTGFRSDRDVREEASELLADRREEGDCVLMRAGYLDLFGGTWGCVLQGVDWVEICLGGEEGDGCGGGVWRMDVDDAVRELGATSGVSASPQ